MRACSAACSAVYVAVWHMVPGPVVHMCCLCSGERHIAEGCGLNPASRDLPCAFQRVLHVRDCWFMDTQTDSQPHNGDCSQDTAIHVAPGAHQDDAESDHCRY